MADIIPHQRADRTQLQQIIVGLSEGIIIIDPDQTIAWQAGFKPGDKIIAIDGQVFPPLA